MKKSLILLLASIFAFSATIGFAACAPSVPPQGSGDEPPAELPDDTKPNDEHPKPEEEQPLKFIQVQQLNYAESTAAIQNPDQGFYIPINVKVTETGVIYSSSTITGATQLYHLRLDISAFSSNAGGTDQPLTDKALKGIGELLSLLRSRNKNAIVRFAYDTGFSGNKNCEPALEIMLGHAKQFCPLLEQYPATVTALEVGMVGPWGEMHSSTAANPKTIGALIKAFLTNTVTLPVSVRTPQMIYNYLGIPDGAPAGYQIPESAYRLGMFNDGYLGSDSDLGTYQDRERDIAFIGGQTAHLPFGGEVVKPESSLHDIEVCLPEMNLVHLSYLNELWNNTVVKKWKDTTVTQECAGASALYYGKTAYEYISNHMGYRFVLKNSTFEYTEKFDSLKISLSFENVGFGNLNKPKKARLLFVNANEEVVREQELGDFCGTDTAEYSLPLDLQNGAYRVYLLFYGEMLNQTPLYTLQFANDGLYDALLRANLIGSIEIIK